MTNKCNNCTQFVEVNTKLGIISWLVGVGLPTILGILGWGVIALMDISTQLGSLDTLHKDVTSITTRFNNHIDSKNSNDLTMSIKRTNINKYN